MKTIKFTVEIEMPEFSLEFKASPYCPYKDEAEYLTSVLRNAYYSPDIKWTILQAPTQTSNVRSQDQPSKVSLEICKTFDHGTFSGCPAHPHSKYPPNFNICSDCGPNKKCIHSVSD